MTDSSSSLGRTILPAGAALMGTYAGLTAARWAYRRTLPSPLSLPPALDLEPHPVEGPDGRAQCYVRPGTGPPVVLLHSFNAVASSREMQPIAEHLITSTTRPVYALDWLGFGRSDRGSRTYSPALYKRQLYQVLNDVLDAPADVIALSLGGEYAARVALQAAPLVRRLVLVSPTGLAPTQGPSTPGRLGLALADRTGTFELLYHRLTRRASLRDYYARQVFLAPDAIPDALLDYAAQTAQVRGAHRAPLRFVDGTLSITDVADDVYARLYRPTLLLTPSNPGPTVQSFEQLSTTLSSNTRDLSHETLPGGLLPHWEAPGPFFDTVDAFLDLQ
ncbi:alpha/beta hydrolase [Salinibacter altiplanensis]|uniref:alpha/beta hydrolase n=1 Tax=Salinibacter altiplanensis TaxID=1803181 RepID=UPI000C9F8D8B|nr:alpha/beta fold hydrolase [Salinibacter altiplanensis]